MIEWMTSCSRRWRPPKKPSSIAKRKPQTSPPLRETRSEHARIVPPVARTSSTRSTRSPGRMASECISRASVPYSRAYSIRVVFAGSLPGLRIGTKPAPSRAARADAKTKPLASGAAQMSGSSPSRWHQRRSSSRRLRKASGSRRRGGRSVKTIPGLGKSGMSRMCRLSSSIMRADGAGTALRVLESGILARDGPSIAGPLRRSRAEAAVRTGEPAIVAETAESSNDDLPLLRGLLGAGRARLTGKRRDGGGGAWPCEVESEADHAPGRPAFLRASACDRGARSAMATEMGASASRRRRAETVTETETESGTGTGTETGTETETETETESGTESGAETESESESGTESGA